MAEINEIRVCIGNYGYYNEGELRDRWITLPKTDSEIEKFLKANGLHDPLHEEIYISDYDGIPLGMPYGDVFSEYTRLDDLNLLAKQMQDAPEWKLERAASAIEAGYVEPRGIVEVMNLIEQADEIDLVSWPDQFDYASDEERLAYAVIDEIGGLGNIGRDALERHFNLKSYGRKLDDEGFVVGERGYLDPGIADVRDGLYDAEDVIEEAKLIGWDGSIEDKTTDALERCVAEIESVGFKIHDGADPALVFAVGNLIENLDDTQREALLLCSDHVSPTLDAAEIGNIVLQADDIFYKQYAYEGPDKHLRLARTCIDEEGGIGNLLSEDLTDCFDYKAYGEEIGQDYLVCDEGYIFCDPNGIDLDRFDRGELQMMIEGSWVPTSGFTAEDAIAAIEAGIDAESIVSSLDASEKIELAEGRYALDALCFDDDPSARAAAEVAVEAAGFTDVSDWAEFNADRCVTDRYRQTPSLEGGKARPASTAGIVGHTPITQTGSLNPSEYSYPPEPGASGRFAFADEASSKAAMEADFHALASQIEGYAVDPDNSPLAFKTPDDQLHAMRVLAAWHGDGEPTQELVSYCNAVEPTLKQSLAARGIAWDRARGAKTPDAAIGAAKESAVKEAPVHDATRSVAR